MNEIPIDIVVENALQKIEQIVEMSLISPIERHCAIINTIKNNLNEYALPIFSDMLNAVAGLFPKDKNEYNKVIEKAIL